MKRIVVVLMILTLAMALSGVVLAAADKPAVAESGAVDMEAAKATFENTCSKCHALSRAMAKKKDLAGWQATVKRMSTNHRIRFGEEISQEDQEAIVQYLLENAGK